ncbi:R3H domain-containing protein-like protein [Emericellopsis cladophorae]|uniref:R3H domain-containing protein-like protein n=1 Tax=Emericellopsis cladophorae TaxID=2686198 RepID=A0A9P9Y6Y1_9HYPO|nr:R3H domain-containing protein-like protein [Emericellopsis cladophorae]KAI6784428.1 R3H domain-containing protein-like protein [Emericellopsis cladophorae]
MAEPPSTSTPQIGGDGKENRPPMSTQPPTGQTVDSHSVPVVVSGTRAESLGGVQLNTHLQGCKESVDEGAGNMHLSRPAIVSRESALSDCSQRADSSSELGTKPPSLDGKSITSGTTFALDEKESLRPDDSASVMAAGDDDEVFSVRGSIFAGSRMGSDLAARARGIQLGDMPDRRLMQATPASSGPGVLTPHSNASEQQARGVLPPLTGSSAPPDALDVIYRQAPDDKLIDAMRDQKDRLYLLRVEALLINFVENSNKPFEDVVAGNSFYRMLAHKLADYYHMTHSYEPSKDAVRIFRTPFCRVPTSLANWNPEPKAEEKEESPPMILPKKIMRRGQEDETGTGSAAPSKPASESGTDSKEGKEKSQSGQKLTREEREEIYKLARERIFGSAEDSAQDADKDNGVSRTSSVSASNNKTAQGKARRGARHRRDDSDGFDSRNNYTPYWSPQQAAWGTGYGQGLPSHASMQQLYNSGMAPGYALNVAGHPNMPGAVPGMAPSTPQGAPAGQGYPTYPVAQAQYPPHAQPQRFPSSGSPYVPSTPGTPQQQQQQQGWGPAPSSPAGYQPKGGSPSIPYAFGQLPAHMNPHDPKSQHPIPGSYNRNHSFNPKTQSFVPGSVGMPPGPGPQPPFTAPTSHHGSPQIGSTAPAFPYQAGPPQPYNGGYGMVRQASNTSAPGYQTAQMPPMYGQYQQPTQPGLQQMPLQHVSSNQFPHTSRPHASQQPAHHPPPPNFNHLPTYGNPASLPQKPANGF